MALILEDRYVRISDIRIGKNVMQFFCKVYDSSDLNKPELESKLITCSYDLNGSNPYIQAYAYLKTTSPYNNYNTDEMNNKENILIEVPEDKELVSNDLIKTEKINLAANDLVENNKPKKNKKSKILLG